MVSLYEGTSELWRSADGVDVFLLPELDGTNTYEEEMIKAVEAAFKA